MGAQDKLPMENTSLQRVKIYRLSDDGNWDDQGTGHVAVDYLERSEDLGLFVVDEEDNETLLMHRIRSVDIYRKQEDKIISWRDLEYSIELALSFQEPTGCSYIWDQIRSVQGNLNFNTLSIQEMAAPPNNGEPEAANFLHKLIQESKDKPKKLATKLYVILQHMRSSGKENSMPCQVISRAMETVINEHGLDIDALKSSRGPLTGGTHMGDSSSAQFAGSSQAAAMVNDSKSGMAEYERTNPQASSRPPVGPSVAGHDIYQGSVSHPVLSLSIMKLRQLDQASTSAIHSGTNVVSKDQNYILPSLEALQNGEVTTMQLDSCDQLSMDSSKNAQNVVIAERNIITVNSSKERKRKMERKHRGTGVRIEVSWEDILECAKNKMSRKGAAEKLQVSISTLKRVCRSYGLDRWPPRNQNIKRFRSFRSSPVENEGQIRQHLNSDLPSNQASDSVALTKPAFQDADIVTIKAKYENNTIKFRLSMPSRLVALQQEVATRLNLEAGTYYIRYEDEENELILIACDQDLQDCINTFKSLGNTSVVVQLELK